MINNCVLKHRDTEQIYNTLEYKQNNLYQILNEIDVNEELKKKYGITVDSDSIEDEVSFLYENEL